MAGRTHHRRLSVGHDSDVEGLTGCTVVLAPLGAVASVDIRGGAPGTLETALLSPYASVTELHAVLLTGGSAPGLAAAAGVTAFLQEKGYGYQTPFAKIPLGQRRGHLRPRAGQRAGLPQGERRVPGSGVGRDRTVEEGSVGAGTGATVGKLLNFEGMMKGGVGLASVEVGGGVTVSALTVVNSLGDVLDERGEILAGARRGGGFAGSKASLLAMTSAPVFGAIESTTLSVVMTDAALDKLQCGIVARMAHDGMARAIDPVHTPRDGDCVFTLATGRRPGNVLPGGRGRRRCRGGEYPPGGAGCRKPGRGAVGDGPEAAAAERGGPADRRLCERGRRRRLTVRT